MAMYQLVEQVCLYLQHMPGSLWSLVGSGPSWTQHYTRKPQGGFHVNLEHNETKLKILLFNH